METYEDHAWCSYSNPSEDNNDDDDDDHHLCRRGDNHRHKLHLAKTRARSLNRSNRRSSFLVDELDMLMDKAATTIQATWRGHLVRKRIMAEHAAAATIQAAWRRFITREYIALQQEQLPPWSRGRSGHRHWQRTTSPTSFKGDGRSWYRQQMDEEKAAEVIQAHYRGYVARRDFCECRKAAVTIQAHWRGYCTRREMAPRLHHTHSPAGGHRPGTYYGYPSYLPGSQAWVGPYPRKHWHPCQVGDPEEWSRVLDRGQRGRPRQQERQRQRERAKPGQAKTCPQCGRCTSIRVLVGVGKGPTSESEVEESECEGHRLRPAPARRPRASTSGVREERPHLGPRPRRAHISYTTSSTGHSSSTATRRLATESPAQWAGQDPGEFTQRYTATHTTSARFTREQTTPRSLSFTSLQQQQRPLVKPPGAPSPGSSEWLYENYCTRRMGEGQSRVFKTRKQLWQVARAATLIQSFWRGWKARQALRQQQEAATKIQSAYRGYKTRVYLIEAGVLSEGDTE